MWRWPSVRCWRAPRSWDRSAALLALPVAASLQAFISTYARRYEVLENPLTEQSPPNAAGKAKSMREPRTLPVEATPGPSTTS